MQLAFLEFMADKCYQKVLSRIFADSIMEEVSFPVFSRTVCPLVPGRAWWIPASDIKPAPAATPENSQEAIDALGIIPAGPDSDIPIVQHAMPCICPRCPIPTGEPTVQAPFKGTLSPYAPQLKTYGMQSLQLLLLPQLKQLHLLLWL